MGLNRYRDVDFSPERFYSPLKIYRDKCLDKIRKGKIELVGYKGNIPVWIKNGRIKIVFGSSDAGIIYSPYINSIFTKAK